MALSFLGQILHSQLFVTPVYPTHDFTGQTVIVTGSNVGLGLEAARHLARLNCARLILAVRTVSKGETAKESILSSTKRTSDCIEVWPLDLSSSASVKAFAKRAEGLERVDVLLENAGLSVAGWEVMEGNEASVQVNVINTFLLALLMLPMLRETAKKFSTTPHLEIVSSEAHFMTSFKQRHEDDIYAKLSDEKTFDLFDR
jgi:retinol dehydrogenase 12